MTTTSHFRYMRGMKLFFPLILLLSPIILAPMASGGETKAVVLRNGSVVEGEVVELGEHYRVTTGTTEMRLAARDVERIAESLVDAYDAKRSELREPQADNHLRLAAWCIRHELWPQAAREINDARVREPGHPALTLFEHRLVTAARAAERRALPSIAEPVADQGAAEETTTGEMAELGALASSLPAGALEDFTRNIQPLLVNNCSLAGCHGTNDDRPFKLNRDLLHGIGNRRSTLRNLDATLRMIDPNHVDQSPIILKAAIAHGGMSTPAFVGSRQRLHGRLVDWVHKVTATEPSPSSAAPSDIELASSTEELPVSQADGLPAEQKAPLAGDQKRPYFWELGAAGERIEAEVQRGTTVRKFTPRDEFDPEIFNRQQSTGNSPGAAKETARNRAAEFER